MDLEENSWPPIHLAWRQKLAAFWSLAWPSGLVAFALLFLVTVGWQAGAFGWLIPAAGVMTDGAFLVGQAIFTPRLLTKRYSSFRIEMERKDGASQTKLSMPEALQVWFRIVWPQAIFFLMSAVLVAGIDRMADPTIARGVGSLLALARFLIVGPYAVGFAVPRVYSTFRLVAYGQRFV